MAPPDKKKSGAGPLRPFRRAVVRGIGVILPPLLTIVIFVWVGSTVNSYVMQPVKNVTRQILVWTIDDQVKTFSAVPPNVYLATKDEIKYHRLPPQADGRTNSLWVPESIYELVTKPENLEGLKIPTTRKGILERYVDLRYLTPQIVIPVFTCIFILAMYLLGKFLAARFGGMAVAGLDKGIERLPLIRNVYGSVKQITDFVFSETNVEYTRVIAVEYPRKGIWSLGLVTGESMLEIAAAAQEPVLSVLIPTSPAPFTGYTITIKKSEAIDLDLTIDQAVQFIVSCGVVIAPQQLRNISDRGQITDASSTNSFGEADASESK
tara:strand:+ start:125 stop:1090 length:966 start_codon:yes stop_codon:yes gene_type:complete